MHVLGTAINIATSCKLLTPAMEPVFVIRGETYAAVHDEIQHAIAGLARRRAHGATEFGLVTTGAALVHALRPTKREQQDDLEHYWTVPRLDQVW